MDTTIGTWTPKRAAGLAALGQVDLDEIAILALEAAEGVQGLDHAGPAGPAAARSAGQGQHGHLAPGQRGFARPLVGRLQPVG